MKFDKRLMIAAALLPVFAIGSGSAASAADKEITFVSYSGTLQDSQIEAWQVPYTAATGIKFQNDAPPDGAKLKAMVEARSVQWDVMDQGAPFEKQNCGTLLEKIDYSKFDLSQFPEGTVSECGVPIYFFGLTFVYNTDKYRGNPPTKLADFFDLAKFPGTRLLPPDFSTGPLEFALLADGVDPKQLYPLDVDRALKKYDTIKRSLIFAKTNGVVQQSLVDGQADMGFVVTGRATASYKAGAHIAAVWDKTILSWDSLMIPKGTPNKEAAMEFIRFATQPEQNKRFAELSGVIAVTTKAKPAYRSDQSVFNPYANSTDPASVVISNMDWWAKNATAVIAKLNPWMLR
jgi:putative spermidine/putrescine transport system substrate-binding protein